MNPEREIALQWMYETGRLHIYQETDYPASSIFHFRFIELKLIADISKQLLHLAIFLDDDWIGCILCADLLFRIAKREFYKGINILLFGRIPPP